MLGLLFSISLPNCFTVAQPTEQNSSSSGETDMALLRFPPFLTYITSVATFRYLQETIFLVISIPCILIVGYLGFKKENIFVEIPPTICTATRQRLSGGVFLQLNHIHPVSSGRASAPSRDHQSTATCEAATRNLTGIVHEAALREGYGEEACVCLFKMDATEENKRVRTGIDEAKKQKPTSSTRISFRTHCCQQGR